MLIRSQNKKFFVNVDCIESISTVRDGKGTASVCARSAYASEKRIYIGEYDNEERAIEVLDEICNAYIGLNCIDRKTGIAVVRSGIFEMPEE